MMQIAEKTLAENLSSHLFWDVDIKNVDADVNKSFIIKRVLEYGMVEDWNAIKKYYTLPLIVSVATSLRDLDSRALSYLAAISQTPKELFRCYTMKPLNQEPLNF